MTSASGCASTTRTIQQSNRRKSASCLEWSAGRYKLRAMRRPSSNARSSTVSKVLRQKEKYLFPEDRSGSPVKRSKSKFPDIERALSSWAKKAQQSGHDLSDGEILEKARHFSHGVGGNTESHLKSLSTSWLEKFKQKNGLAGGRLMRRASETNITDRVHLSTGSPLLSASHSGSVISPASPTGQPSPLSGSRSDEEVPVEGMLDYGAYKHTNSQSTTSLSSAFTDAAGSSFSGSALSPTAPFTFSPDPNVGGFLSSEHSRQLATGAGSNFQRPRSQTFPTLDIEYLNQPAKSEAMTPKFQPSSTAPSSALDSPMHEMNPPPFALDTAMASPPTLHHSSSNSSMAARSATPLTTSGISSTPMGYSPSSPSQEDARRAADTLLSFMQSVVTSGIVDQNDFVIMLRLTEKLKLHQHQAAKAAGVASQSMGGLTRIPEGDSEMAPVSMGMKLEPMITG